MKINVSFLPESINGYENFSVMVNQGKISMDQYDTGEVQEILAPSIIEFLPPNVLGPTLQNWVSKLSHQGHLIVDFIDCYTVSRLFFLQNLSVNDFNLLMHGESKQGWDEKKQNFTVPQVTAMLEGLGLKILQKKLDGIKATLIAERP